MSSLDIEAFRRLLAGHPEELKTIESRLEHVLSDAEIDAYAALLNADFDSLTSIEELINARHPSSPPSPISAAASPSKPGSRRISIRISHAMIAAFKAEGAKRCVPYQTLMKRALNSQLDQWSKEAKSV